MYILPRKSYKSYVTFRFGVISEGANFGENTSCFNFKVEDHSFQDVFDRPKV